VAPAQSAIKLLLVLRIFTQHNQLAFSEHN
jgi:hypothetical protein